MDSIYNNIVLDEDIFMNNCILYKEVTEEQREQLDNGHAVKLPNGGIMVSILIRLKNDD